MKPLSPQFRHSQLLYSTFFNSKVGYSQRGSSRFSSSQLSSSQKGISIVSLLGVMALLLIIAAVIYLFLPVDDEKLSSSSAHSQLQTPLNTEGQEGATSNLSPADLETLKPVENAEPGLKRIAEQIESERNSQPVSGGTLTLNTEQLTQQQAQQQQSQQQLAQQTESVVIPKVQQKQSNAESLQTLKPKQSDSSAGGSSTQTSILPAEWLRGDFLAGSDELVRKEIAGLDSSLTLLAWLVDEELIRHFVAMVDNIANGAIPNKQMVLQPPAGNLVVSEVGDNEFVLKSANFARYQQYMSLLSKLPPEAVIASYQRFYPLMQKAYAELGYPKQSFHQRLQDAIEVVLNAPMPDPGKEYRLKRPSVMYLYSDETLEKGPDVQKLLVRIGPENAVLLKETLWQWKRLLIQLEHG